MRLGLWIATLGAATAFFSGTAVASATAPGQPDPSFNGGTGYGPSGASLLAVAAKPDGSVVAAGTTGAQAIVAEFSAGGRLQTSFTAAGPGARGVAVQPDGRIVIVGGNSIGGGGMVIERLNPDGTPDASFGSAGVVNLFASPSGQSDGQANAVVIQPDGKIVVAGTALGGDGYPRAALVRLNPNGSLDGSFAGGGTDMLDLGRYSEANAVALQPDGQLLLGGTARPNLQSTNAIVARIKTNGSLDTSFGNGSGYFAWGFAINSAVTYVNGVALQPDGKVVLAGSAGDSSTGSDMIVFRLTSSGALDSSFASGGVYRARATDSTDQYTQSLPAPGAAGVVVLGGKILAAGYYDSYTVTHLALWALSSTGQPDPGFGSGGRVIGPAGSEALAVAPAPGGNVVLAGQSGGNGLVARYGVPAPEPGPPGASGPTVSTGAATVLSATSARVSGRVNPQGLPTTYRFQYGPTAAYGSSTAATSAGSGAGDVTASYTLTGLSAGTTYHYRIVASSNAGSPVGADQTFTLPATTGPPLVGPEAARSINEVSARVVAQVKPSGLTTSYHVQYGRHALSESATRAASLPGSAPRGVSVLLRGLRPGTTYHYRLVASNRAGTSYGRDQTFKTLPRLRGAVSGIVASYRLSALGRSGLRIQATCSQACSIHAALVIPARLARRLGIRGSGGRIAIARGSATLKRAGQRILRLVLTRPAAKDLLGQRHVSAALVVVMSPAGGGPAISYSKSLNLTG